MSTAAELHSDVRNHPRRFTQLVIAMPRSTRRRLPTGGGGAPSKSGVNNMGSSKLNMSSSKRSPVLPSAPEVSCLDCPPSTTYMLKPLAAIALSQHRRASSPQGSRPHLLDKTGRDVTPRPLVPTKSGVGAPRNSVSSSLPMGPVRRGGMAESTTSVSNEADISDGLSVGGFSQSLLSDDGSTMGDGDDIGGIAAAPTYASLGGRGGGAGGGGESGANCTAQRGAAAVSVVRGAAASLPSFGDVSLSSGSGGGGGRPSSGFMLLQETDTIVQFSMTSLRVLQDTPEAKAVRGGGTCIRWARGFYLYNIAAMECVCEARRPHMFRQIDDTCTGFIAPITLSFPGRSWHATLTTTSSSPLWPAPGQRATCFLLGELKCSLPRGGTRRWERSLCHCRCS